MKLVKTVSPAVLCNEITIDGLQWLFIPELHSDFIRMSKEGGMGGKRASRRREREREQTAGIKSSHKRDGMRGNGRDRERKKSGRMNE